MIPITDVIVESFPSPWIKFPNSSLTRGSGMTIFLVRNKGSVHLIYHEEKMGVLDRLDGNTHNSRSIYFSPSGLHREIVLATVSGFVSRLHMVVPEIEILARKELVKELPAPIGQRYFFRKVSNKTKYLTIDGIAYSYNLIQVRPCTGEELEYMMEVCRDGEYSRLEGYYTKFINRHSRSPYVELSLDQGLVPGEFRENLEDCLHYSRTRSGI